MLLGLSQTLPSLVGTKFAAAKGASSLLFSATELSVIHTAAGIPFQLRYCPALSKKPVPRNEQTAAVKKPDPFDNPPIDLLVAEVPQSSPSHVLVLNKFPVIEEHFILATKVNKPQTHALERDDLEMTYACLKAWENGNAGGQPKRLFAFFNSGEHSGASQPHRHLQFLPLESMTQPEQSSGWTLLLDLILADSRSDGKDSSTEIRQHPLLPFKHFACRLPSEPTGSQLHAAYNVLYQRALRAIEDYRKANPGKFDLHDTSTGSLPISYNLAMTTEGMAIIPRLSEGSPLRQDDGTEVGFVALNGTVLGGTLMVKQEEEWNLIRQQPEKLDFILGAIGIPSDS